MKQLSGRAMHFLKVSCEYGCAGFFVNEHTGRQEPSGPYEYALHIPTKGVLVLELHTPYKDMMRLTETEVQRVFAIRHSEAILLGGSAFSRQEMYRYYPEVLLSHTLRQDGDQEQWLLGAAPRDMNKLFADVAQ